LIDFIFLATSVKRWTANGKIYATSFKDHEELKRLRWALLKNAENLIPSQKKKLDWAFHHLRN